jgi:hypothetical protein
VEHASYDDGFVPYGVGDGVGVDCVFVLLWRRRRAIKSEI